MGNIREMLERIEFDTLAPRAAKSAETRGRDREEPEDDLRPSYQRDRDRIIHCKSFRRLKHKTQVFLAPEAITTSPCYFCSGSQQTDAPIANSLRLNESSPKPSAGKLSRSLRLRHSGKRLEQLVKGGSITTASRARRESWRRRPRPTYDRVRAGI